MSNEKQQLPICLSNDCVNLLELIKNHFEEYYEQNLSVDALKDVFWIMCDVEDLSNAIYDAAEKYAEDKGWEMTI